MLYALIVSACSLLAALRVHALLAARRRGEPARVTIRDGLVFVFGLPGMLLAVAWLLAVQRVPAATRRRPLRP